jgi:spermidine/putrescine-binding protein
MNVEDYCRSRRLLSMLISVILLALILSACGAPAATPAQPTAKPSESAPTAQPANTPLPAATTAATKPAEPSADVPFVSNPSGQKTDSGFECPEPQPRLPVTSTELNLYIWTEYVPQDILDCFEMVYGVKINRGEYSSNEEMYAKLAQGGSQYDLAQPSDYIIEVMIRTGIIDKLDKSQLPNLKNIAPAYFPLPYDPTGEYIVPYQAGTESIMYNAEKVNQPITSWEDLWRPEFKDRMVFVDDPRYVIGMVLLTEGKDPNTTNPADLETIKPKLAELIEGVKVFNSDNPRDTLLNGDADVGFIWNGDAFLAAQEDPAFKYVYPEEGTFVWRDGYAVVKDAPHLDAAYAWLNYSLQPDVFWLMLRDWPYTNPNQAALEYAKNATFTVKDADGNDVTPAQLYEAYMASDITNPPPDVLAKAHNIEDVGEATPLYDELWTEVKSGN